MEALSENGVVRMFRSFFSFENEVSETSHFVNHKKQRSGGGKVVPLRDDDLMQGVINIKSPRTMDDARDAADKLREGRVVIMNLGRLEKDLAKEVLYFLSGTIYALAGDSKKVGSDIFLFAPEGISVTQLDEIQEKTAGKSGIGFDEM